MSGTLISFNNVSFDYESKTVVEGLNFGICDGDYISVVGENGSGKSTLIKGLLGLKAPSSGRIEFAPGLKKSEIGYLPQQTTAQKTFPASVGEVVMTGFLGSHGFLPIYNRREREETCRNLEYLGLSGFERTPFSALSGGQQQRVLLARALCAAKKVLVLDEPSSGLDPVVTHDFYRLIKNLNTDKNLTIIMVTHDIHCAIDFSTKILHIKNEQFFFGTPEDYRLSKYGKQLDGDIHFSEGEHDND